MVAGGVVFYWGVVRGDVKTIRVFRRWTVWTAVVSAILVLLAAMPIETVWPNRPGLRDIAAVANAIGPLLLSVSVTLASIFYSAGEWYETAQRFRLLGIADAKPNRKGRQSERARFWQDVLRGTKHRIVISGTTLGGWFVSGWEETRESLLTVLPRARVEVLLADPGESGFKLRADDPGEAGEAKKTERARPRASKCING